MQTDAPFKEKNKYVFEDLVKIMVKLRGEGGCPWDREQTHRSLSKNLIEETYEVIEGIDTEDDALLQEELGDLLLQIVFHAQIASETARFDIDDVADGICKKLIRRHPHIFGSVTADTSAAVLRNWDNIKRQEKGQTSVAHTMEHIYRGLPSLMRAQKIQSKAAKAGFDWPDVSGAMDKLSEEQAELTQALAGADRARILDEAGDLLFACVNVVRHAGLDSEEALRFATDKFQARFTEVEALVAADGLRMEDLPIGELDRYWDRVKQTK